MTKNLFHTFLFLGTLCFFSSCASDNDTEAGSDQQPDTSIPDMAHNSQNALDWMGTYRGITPCADCEGIETALALHENNTYELTTRYLGKGDEIFRESGSFTWNENGNQIDLDITDEGSRSTGYLIQENQIVQLDLDGNRITGDLADHYVLTKVSNPLADRYWKLKQINNIPVDSSQTGPKDPHIILHPLENNASGTGGCNSIAATYEISDENSISFSQVISTRMACQDAAYEMNFIQLLEGSAMYSLSNDTLVLLSEQGDSLLQFIEQPEFN